MSDVWQGPGWWLASDGKWYPPEAQPGGVFDSAEAASEPTGDPENAETSLDESAGSIAVAVEEPLPAPVDPFVAFEPAPFEPAIDNEHAADNGFSHLTESAAIANENANLPGWQAIVDVEPETDAADTDADDLWSIVPPPSVGTELEAPEETFVAAELGEQIEFTEVEFEEVEFTEADFGDVGFDPTGSGFTAPIVESLAPSAEANTDFENAAFESPAIPEVELPEVELADVEIPEIELPDVEIPDVELAEVEIPEVELPDVELPDVELAEVEIPEVDPPDVEDGWSSAFDARADDVEVPIITPPTDLYVPTTADAVQAPSSSAGQVPIIPSDVGTALSTAATDVSSPDLDLDIPDVSPSALSVNEATQDVAPAMPSVVIEEAALPTRGSAVDSQTLGPIERNEAWRTPTTDTSVDAQPPSVGNISTTPEVVDLAIPDESPLNLQDASGRNWRAIFQGLAVLLAIIGLALTIIWYLYRDDTSSVDSVPPTTSAVATTAPTTLPEQAKRLISIFDLRAGDCIVGDIAAGPVTEIEKVDCIEPHGFEVYREALIDSSIVDYEAGAIAANAEEICRNSLAAYIPSDDERDLRFKFLQPTEDSWNRSDIPDRVITCLLYDEDGPLIGKAA